MLKDAKDNEVSALAGGILMLNVRWLTAPRWLSVSGLLACSFISWPS